MAISEADVLGVDEVTAAKIAADMIKVVKLS